MTVSLIRAAESHTGTTGSVSETSFQWALGQAGDTPKGVLVFVMQGVTATDYVSSVTYGGQALTAVSGGRATDTATELGACTAYFLGGSVPSGAQNVVVNRTSNTTVMYAVAFLLGASYDTKIAGTPVLQQENAAMTAVTYNDGLTSGASIILAGGYTGDNTPAPAPSTGMTDAGTLLGTYAYSFGAAYETTPTYGSRSRGLEATNDDRAQVVLAVTESIPVTGTAAVTLKRATLTATGTYTPVPVSGTAALTLKVATLGTAGTYTPQAITGTGALALKRAGLDSTGTAASASDTISIERRTGALGEWGEVYADDWDTSPWTDTGPFTNGETYYYRARRIVNDVPGEYSNVEAVAYVSGPITGTAALALKRSTLSAAGTYTPLAITGTAALTLKRSTLGGAGAQQFAGTAALALNRASLAAAATYTATAITGAASLTLKHASLTAAGTYAPTAITGTAALTLRRAILNGAGTQQFAGSASLTLKRATLSATGTYAPQAITGTASFTAPHATVAAAGTNTPPGCYGTVTLTAPHARLHAITRQTVPDVDVTLHLERSAWTAHLMPPAWTADTALPAQRATWRVRVMPSGWTTEAQRAAWSGALRKDH